MQLSLQIKNQAEQIRKLENTALELTFETENFDGKPKNLYLLHFGYSKLDRVICHLARQNGYQLDKGVNCDNLVASKLTGEFLTQNVDFEGMKSNLTSNSTKKLNSTISINFSDSNLFPNILNTSSYNYIIGFYNPFNRYIWRYTAHKKTFKLNLPNQKFQPFNEWLEKNTVPNYHTRRICGKYCESVASINRTHLEFAKRMLTRFDAVLVHDRFEASLDVMYSRFGWNRDIGSDADGVGDDSETGVYGKRDVLDNPFLVEFETSKAKFHELVMYDNELYEFARYLNRKQMEESYFWKLEAKNKIK